MFRLLFVFFVIVPIIEISVLMQVGEWLGAWPTVGVVILTAWVGAKFVRQQGLSTLQSVQEKTAQGEMPSDEIITGIMLLIAGVLLVTPGFVTDIFGLSLLVPAVRQAMVKKAQQHIVTGQMSSIHMQSSTGFNSADQHDDNVFSGQPKSTAANNHQGQTIEGEYERKE